MRRLFLKLIRRRKLHAELEAELAHHRELSKQHGNPIGLGNEALVQERALDLWRFSIVENVWRDFRQAMRGMRNNALFTIAAISSLALGIGITTVMFTLLNTVAFRPLAYSESSRLVWLTQVLRANSTDEITLTPDFLDWRRTNRSFADMAAYNYVTSNMTGGDEPAEVHVARASASLLSILGTAPVLGRNFTKEEDHAGRAHVAMLTYGVWQSRFAADPAVLGKAVLLDGDPFTVVGVLGKDFVFPGPDPVQILAPLAKDEEGELARNGQTLTIIRNVIGKLKPGITQQQATADLMAIQAHLPLPPFKPTITIKMLPLRDHLYGNAKSAGIILVAASLFFLLIASANVGSLLLVRLLKRNRELAIRNVLGGSRGRIMAQLLTENTLLAVLACLAGLMLAYLLRKPLLMMASVHLPAVHLLPVDFRVVAFTCSLSLLTVLVFGLLPAWNSSRVRLAEAMKAGQQSTTGSTGSLRTLSLIVVAEVAAVLVLGISATLMMKSLWRMRHADLGFKTEHLLTATIPLRGQKYQDQRRRNEFIADLLARLKRQPGVELAAVTDADELPPGTWHATNTFRIEGQERSVDSRQKPITREQSISESYFAIMHIPILQGRLLNLSDQDGATPVVLVSKLLANKYLKEGALRRRIQFGSRDAPWHTIVGVVGDVKTSGLDASPEPVIYVPYRRSGRIRDVAAVIRSGLPAASIAPSIRKTITEIDNSQPVARIETIDNRLDLSVARPRFTTDLLFGFACLATLLGMLGVYGVISFRIRFQIRDIAVRQALGAQPADLIRHVLRQGASTLVPGIIIGLLASLALNRVLSNLLYEVKANDPTTYAMMGAAVLVVGMAACYIPAWSATRTDPLVWLRHE